MSPALKDLLFHIRQHAGFRELLAAVEKPRLPRYRPSKPETLEQLGARTAFWSGETARDEQWRALLTGTDPARDNETSQQE